MQQYSEEFQEIISQMIQPNWQNRPSCEQLLNKYFNGEFKNKRLSRFLRVGGRSARKQEGSLWMCMVLNEDGLWLKIKQYTIRICDIDKLINSYFTFTFILLSII